MKKKEKKTNLPVKAKSTELITVQQEKANPLDITQKLHHLKNRTEVRKHLPEILGRVKNRDNVKLCLLCVSNLSHRADMD